MTYSVQWTLDALNQLSALEQAADDPGRIRSLAVWLDYALRRTPHDLGESRAGIRRLWFGDAFGIYFEVDDAAYAVRVIAAGPSRRRR